MYIQSVKLQTANLASQRIFYAQTLGFEIVEDSLHYFTIQIGQSQLTLVHGINETPHLHHFAFNVPEHQFQAALAWLEMRVPILSYEGRKVIKSQQSWDAHMIYFEDADGNILEFIARHRIPASDAPAMFGIHSIQSISEMGLVASEIQTLTEPLMQIFGLPVFSGDPTGTFCAIGGDMGLLICAAEGRAWFPTQHRLAGIFPVEVTLVCDVTEPKTLEIGPYTLAYLPG